MSRNHPTITLFVIKIGSGFAGRGKDEAPAEPKEMSVRQEPYFLLGVILGYDIGMRAIKLGPAEARVGGDNG